MRIIHSDDTVTVIELISDEEIWELVYNKEISIGDEIPSKLVVQNAESYLTVSTPKLINDEGVVIEHTKRERMTIDFRDFVLMNRTLKQIFDYKSCLLPR